MASSNRNGEVVLKYVKKHDGETNGITNTFSVRDKAQAPENRNDRSSTPVPISSTNILSYVFVTWLSPLIYHISRNGDKRLDDGEVWSCSVEESCQTNGERLKIIWQNELKTKGRKDASFLKACLIFLKPLYWRYILASVLFSGSLIAIAVFVIPKMVQFLEDEDQEVYIGLILVATLLLLNSLQTFGQGYGVSLGSQFGTRLRGAAMYLVYEKILQLQNLRKNTVGMVVNLFVADSLRLYTAVFRLWVFAIFIVSLVFGISGAFYLIGWWSFIGAATFGVITLFQVVITKIIARIQKRKSVYTDARVQKMKEFLGSIRLIKMWAWEEAFIGEILADRRKEKSKAEALVFLTAFGLGQTFVTPTMATVLTLTLYSYFGNHLNAELAFAVLSTFAALRFAALALPAFGRYFADMQVSCQRIQELLLKSEKVDVFETVSRADLAIEFHEASFQWPSDEEDSMTYTNTGMEDEVPGHSDHSPKTYSREKKENTQSISHDVLTNVSFEAVKGSLSGICGRVGSGKSAFLTALLGELKKTGGSLAMDGTIAFCPQEPWIFNDTVKENILFGNPFVQERYEKVLAWTCLATDLATFPAGDDTEVGDKGITMSGGQRQRVSLARALYSDRDIYLLDDPLSALDVTVGQEIFHRCIQDALRDKTVVLTTHQLQYLQTCDQVILLENGQIAECGTHLELLAEGKEYASLINSFYEKTSIKKDISIKAGFSRSSTSTDDLKKLDVNNGKLTEDETLAVGAVSLSTYSAYNRAMGGFFVVFLLVLVNFISEGIVWGCDWWLTEWLEQLDNIKVQTWNTTNETTLSNVTGVEIKQTLSGVAFLLANLDTSTFMLIYGLFVVILCVINVIRCGLLAKTSIKGSQSMHTMMLDKVIHSPTAFFDKTPTGRIVNRFSADLDMVDAFLPVHIAIDLMCLGRIVLAIAGISSIFPIMLVAVLPALVALAIIGRFARNSTRQMKRMENISRSALVGHVTSTAQGLNSVRIYERESIFKERLIKYLDSNALFYMLFEMCVNWMTIWGCLVGAVLVVATGLTVVILRGSIPSSLGSLALSICIQVVTVVGMTLQELCLLDARFTSVERLNDYICNLQPEGQENSNVTPVAAEWPISGDVRFRGVSVAYSEKSKLVLKDVSFSVTSGEKIGIIGRTGAGKSTVGAVLFRLMETHSGSVLIDGVDIGQLNLQVLRSRLCVVPQEPVLFSGTIRDNLDPLKTKRDEEIWSALEKSQMKEKVRSLNGNLDYILESGGESFSVGERQLLCMTRALLRKSPVVLLDEATANVDTETDYKIQQIIREAFHDRTVLIIAHRLNTIQRCDKILVMDDGKVHEFDSPENLLKREDSLYRAMWGGSESF